MTRDTRDEPLGELSAQTQTPSPAAGSDERYRKLFEFAPIGIVYSAADGYYLDANASICRMLGYSHDELVGLHARDIIVPEQVPRIQDTLDEINTQSADYRQQWRFRRKDGSVFDGDVSVTKFADGTLLGMIRDITQQMEHEREIARLTRLYDALSQINQAIVWTADRGALFSKVCEVLVERGGFRMAWIGWHDVPGQRLAPVATYGDDSNYTGRITVYTDGRPEARGPAGTAFSSGKPYVSNDLLDDPATGSWRGEIERCGFLASASFPVRLAGQVCGTLNVYADRRDVFHDREVALLEEAATDISFGLDNFAREESRQFAEQVLRQEKRFSDMLIESMPGMVYLYDLRGKLLRWNQNFEKVLGYTAAELGQMNPLDLIPPEDRAAAVARSSNLQAAGGGAGEVRIQSKDGRILPYFFSRQLLVYDGQNCLAGVGIDISARKHAEEEWMRLARLIENSQEFIALADIGGRITFMNPAGRRLIGLSPDADLGSLRYTDYVAPDWQTFFRDTVLASIRQGGTWEGEMQLRNVRTGELIDVYRSNFIIYDETGAPDCLATVTRDITRSKRLEEQLRQSQKMEAIGQLAGGVAHDFNNLLTVIGSYSELLLSLPDTAGQLHAAARAIGEAGERAAALTRQLLGFSRRTMLQPKVLDLNAHVLETGSMLRRLIGEDVLFTTALAPDLAHVKVDPAQLDQVLMNLAVNARDAMPTGGNLTVETANVHFTEEYVSTHLECAAGPHVMLAMTDSGSGIPADIKPHIFDPFFTTKASGKGTGLGLAMVLGIVHQSGGCIYCYSEPGQGTTFKIYFPAVVGAVPAAIEEAPRPRVAGTETVLLVEDDEAVREVALLSLEMYGFNVITAEDGDSALRVAAAHDGRIDLLLTDLVMPNMSGADLAKILCSRLPHLKVLFMSGYTSDTVVRHGLLDASVAFIQKPYTPEGLAGKVRAVLDARATPGDVASRHG